MSEERDPELEILKMLNDDKCLLVVRIGGSNNDMAYSDTRLYDKHNFNMEDFLDSLNYACEEEESSDNCSADKNVKVLVIEKQLSVYTKPRTFKVPSLGVETT